ncbi:cis-prenyltransferase [Coelomomyces lativittatus]|nr:cis-prenyltransferase [Coelomomyces lativittatus]
MIIEKLNLLAKESSTIGIYKLRIRILGQIDLLPLNVQRAAFEAEKATLNNSGCLLNICIPYTSRQELLQAVEKSTPPYTSHRFESYLYTGHVPTIDVLIRTCGDHRLSDFMLYQCNDGCQLEFVQHAWPEFTFWDLLPILAEFQLHALAQRHVPTLLLNTNLIKNIPWDEFRYDVSIRSEEMEQPSGS